MLERRQRNLGFITKTAAFREPTEAEKAACLAVETKSWQGTIGKTHWKTSGPYSSPLGHGINLRRTRESEDKRTDEAIEKAREAYLKTPMDFNGVLKAHGIDVSVYENPETKWDKFKTKFKNFFNFWGTKGN